LATKTSIKKENTETPKESSKLLKIVLFILITLTIVVSCLAYQIFTSEAMSQANRQAILSIFHKKEKEKLFALDEFTIKLADGSYVQLSMNVGYVGDEEEIKQQKPVLRDKIIFEMMKLDSKHLHVQQIDKTKALLTEKLKPILHEAEIQNIYMDNLVLQ
jgi:flagellar basal body-associated protein FliL